MKQKSFIFGFLSKGENYYSQKTTEKITIFNLIYSLEFEFEFNIWRAFFLSHICYSIWKEKYLSSNIVLKKSKEHYVDVGS